jgi:HSP20 family protein
MTRLAPFPTWFDRVAADVLGSPFAPAAPRGPRTSARTTPEGLELRLELPGYAESDIEITVEGRVLTVTARRDDGDGAATGRKVSVGEGYDLDAVRATYRHGLLTVVVPTVRPTVRKVAITVAPEAVDVVEPAQAIAEAAAPGEGAEPTA